MRTRPKGISGVVRETFRSWSEDKAPRMAAALSYYTIFSIAPLLVLVIAITGFIIGNNAAVRSQILAEVRQFVGPQGADLVRTLIANTNLMRDGLIATLISIIMLIFGATGVFAQLKDALNTIWEVAPERGFEGAVKERLSGMVMILGLGFLLLVSLVVSTALSVLNQFFTSVLGGETGFIALLLNYGIQILVITVIFAAIFAELPDVEVRWSNVWVGALVTAVLFLIGQFLFSLYLSTASPASPYGAAGSVVVLLLWVYFSSLILFLGAEFTRAYTYARGAEVVPKEGARLLTTEDRIQQGIPRQKEQERPMPAEPREYAPAGAVPIPISGQEHEAEDSQVGEDRIDNDENQEEDADNPPPSHKQEA